MPQNADFYNTCLSEFKEIVHKPANFLQISDPLCDQLKSSLKKCYDYAKSEQVTKTDALSELGVKNFDLEQIWQQIELQNESLTTHCVTCVSRLVAGKSRLLFNNLQKSEIEDDGGEIGENSDASNPSSEDLNDVESSDDENETTETREPPKRSIVDDDFFKLDEMERFLREEEKKEGVDSGNDSESEASVDLFESDSGDSEDEAKTAKYKDFFVQNEEKPSTFELRQKRLAKKIEEIEEEAIQDKSWQLKGEITGEKRPQNSLLEEVVEFDMTTRPPPVMTEQTTMQLEDIIKRRIKDKVFDSVERKTKPVENLLDYKKKIVLDQEKSKESLAQIYEKEFLQAQEPEDKEKEEPELHKEINSLMRKLFTKLDSLSNFHFTPKPAVPDLKIISNLPAISVEEVVPTAVSDATLLAPEEIQKKPKGDFVGKNERTTTDKKRERRKKKLKQKIHAKTKKETVTGKNVKMMAEKGKKIKSSKEFFTQLQEQVQLPQIKRKTSPNNNKKSAKKLKL
ncbi:U3 small nucleolar ribonucleoprotein protein MPP10 [Tribolium madens]|uniref:U3 small nucleolar ribonucleoprotein protein MPP10 n=1 Tax=Tribolium madens TaxID=41895 RepID=UPI001CF739A5|nr:U3 small nucleolar ribonucleoprotein protein MPP10 [Tribolium madens]